MKESGSNKNISMLPDEAVHSSSALLAFHQDSTSVQLRNPFTDREAKPATSQLTRTRFVDSVKADKIFEISFWGIPMPESVLKPNDFFEPAVNDFVTVEILSNFNRK